MATPQLPPPSNPAMLPVLAAVTYVAAVVALWGILSLALNRDVIDIPHAGPLLGPVMVASAAVITWLISWRAKRLVLGAIIALVASWLGMIAVGVIGFNPPAGDWYVGYTGSGPHLTDFTPLGIATHFAISPFIAGAAVLSAFTVLATAALRPQRKHPENAR